MLTENSGGLMTVLTLPQIVYLDFDGELTSYNGEILTIDEVSVVDSHLTPERVAVITAALNEQFSAQNVHFLSDLSDLSDQSDYSTIYIGKTTAFEPFGNFAGLAETVDSGNKNKSDKAFVILDSTVDDAQIIEAIAHETSHLTGTLDHGGNGLKKYAADIIYVSRGMVSSGVSLYTNSMWVFDGGRADDTTVSGVNAVNGGGGVVRVYNGGEVNRTSLGSCGFLYVSSGGVANGTVIQRNGYLNISLGGKANTTVNNGSMRVFNGGAAENTVVDHVLEVLNGGFAESNTVNGCLRISSGGRTDSTVVNSGGELTLYAGGSAENVIAADGAELTLAVAPGTYISGTYNGVAFELDDAHIQNYIVHDGYLNVSSGGLAENITVASSGIMVVSSGGSADNVTVNEGGRLRNDGGGCITNAIVNAGGQMTAARGIESKITVNAGGFLTVESNGSAFEIKENGGNVSCNSKAVISFVSNTFSGLQLSGGRASLHSGTTAADAEINSMGYLLVYSSGAAEHATVNYCGNVSVYEGGTANSAVVNSGGHLRIFSGGKANHTEINSSGSVEVSSGGRAESTCVNPGGELQVCSTGSALAIRENGGRVFYNQNANVSFLSNTFSNLTLSGNTATLHSGTTASDITMIRGLFHVYNGGVALGTVISSATVNVYNGGWANSSFIISSSAAVCVSNGGFADNTVVSGGALQIGSGGCGDHTTLRYGFVNVLAGGKADNTSVYGGYLDVSSGGLAENTILNRYMRLHAGGSAANISINSNGSLTVFYNISGISGGNADAVTVNAGGSMTVYTGGTATAVKENGGYVEVREEANVSFAANIFSSLTLTGGATLHSGTTANSTTLNGCELIVYSSGNADNTIVNNKADLYVYTGGTANNTVVNSGGNLKLSGGTAGGNTINTSADFYLYGGTAGNNTIAGNMRIYSGATASDTAVTSGGRLFIYDSGSANHISIASHGQLDAYGNCVLNDVVVDGKMWVSSNGTVCNDITVNNFLYVLRGNINRCQINAGGSMLLYSTASASEIKENGGYVDLGSNAACSFVSNTFSGLNLTGSATVHSGTTANSTTINSGAYLAVFSSGLVSDSVIESEGKLSVFSGGTAENTTVNDKGILAVGSGGFADKAIICSGGSLHVFSGSVNSAVISSGGSVLISNGGIASNVIIDGKMTVGDTGIAGDITVNGGGTLLIWTNNEVQAIKENGGYVYTGSNTQISFVSNTFRGLQLTGIATLHSGTTAESATVISGGTLYIYQNGCVHNTVVQSGGRLEILSNGGMISGTLQIESGAVVSAYGAVIDFTVAEQTVPETALINNWRRISGGNNAIYTITVNADQAAGEYILAEDAAGFSQTVTVKTENNIEIGTLSVNSSLSKDGKLYSLNNQDGTLALNVKAMIPITITAGDASKMYDGTALTATDYTYSGTLFQGDKLEVTVSGTLTDAGTASSTISNYKVMRGDVDVTADYTFNESINGKLEVIKRNVTLTSADASKVYDGTPLTNDTITVSGDGFAEGEGATYNVTGRQLDVGSSENTFTYMLNSGTKTENYNINSVYGTLSVTAAEKKPAKSDIDDNGISDVMFQYTGGDYQIGFWMNGTNTWQGQGISQPSNWELLGAYDMDQNGKADIVMRGNIQIGENKGAYIGYYKDGDVNQWQNISFLNNPNDIDWRLAIGNMTGNESCNSIVWHAPELGALGVWTDGTSSWVSLAGGFDSSWNMLGCGDFDGNGKDEILFSNSGNLYTTDIDQKFASLGGWGSDWEVKTIGDFSGDDQDDIILQNGNIVVKFENGLAENWSSIGVMDANDWFIVGAGDYNSDFEDDLLVRQYSTGMLGYYESGDMNKWVELGRGVDMNWTVIA